MTDPVVLLEELPAGDGGAIAVATLNAPATLNALSLDMIHLLAPALDAWADRDDVHCVVLKGAGDRAFCAGGDIQDLYRAMVRNRAAAALVDDLPERFFEDEYRLDFKLHRYAKPVVALGHGVVMGGGLGLFSAARHRVVTATSRIAMPEVTIGLFPDAGATWLLRNLAFHHALFLGATGSHMNSGDAVHIGLATHCIGGERDVVAALGAARWGADADADAAIEDALEALAEPVPESNLVALDAALETAVGTPPAHAADVCRRLEPLAGHGKWAERGIATMRRGCPTSVGLVLEQLKRAPALDLAGCFRLEMVVASHCARNGDFAEGVRALLIDKDNAPAWRHGYDAALDAHVASHFEPLWAQNPIADL